MRGATKSFLCFLGLMAAMELIVRVGFVRSMTGRFDYGYHPTAGFVEQQDGTVRLEGGGSRRFFRQAFPRERPADTFRILMIGDSVPRGASVASSYTGQLGELLRSQGLKTESLNLGLPGYGARRKHLVLEQALRYQPSLVILHLNDSNEYEDEREWRRREEFRGWHPKNWLMKSLALRRLYEMKQERVLWLWLPAAIRQQRAATDADAQLSAALNPEVVHQWQQLVQSQTTASVALARTRGVRILVISQARVERRGQGAPTLNDNGLDAFADGLKREGVTTLSMKAIFSGSDLAAMFSDTAHLRPAGHQAMAAAIVAELNRAGWAPAPPDR